ncbi:ATP-binding cassette domain-containing protein [Azospirillum sp. RWY-5-1]|uniref:ATP-binding cassette domain-containing protein n=1 Tax=Azospirillum oleiclasticum TaxID=2735135 RepID=A0ABX2T4W6_9PROT|nr:ATP-binding cassette domain-containing protein [Azospirillum oleiclasticum]NYZ12143.1 ATP-binding cassette domain-containing protein [Azospirillum oleiclasticum]NYZ19303.1 ATP-binding cassette domain-containing protein [Azospirillum oleiclasticum]
MTTAVLEKPILSLRGLTIVAPGGTTLVENASFDIGAGEIVLLVGPSGSGKSTIINLLSGLPDAKAGGWRVTGTLDCGGRHLDLSRERSDVGGLVFQDNALFDDLTAGENLRIAADHAPATDGELRTLATSLLPDVAADKPVSSCSGGQQQRVAIARTLLANRPILFFDEPNSGLDIRSSRALAGMVRDICKRMGKPAVIVAHHVEDLLPEADRVLLLDTRNRCLRAVEPSLDAIERELLALDPSASRVSDGPATAEPSAAPWEGRLPSASRGHWFSRYFLEYFWVLCASPLMLMYVAIGGMIVGFVEIWFGFNYHSFGGYLKSLLHDETLVGLGLIQVTVAVPLITGILVVARNNAIIAADLGNRVLSSQFRAMANLRIPAMAYLIGSVLLNMVFASVVLMAVSMSTAAWTSLQTWHLLFPGQSSELFRENFFRVFLNGGPHVTMDLVWVLVKTVTSSVVAGLAAIVIGLRKKDSVVAINYAIAESIIAGVSITLFVHAIVGIFQF